MKRQTLKTVIITSVIALFVLAALGAIYYYGTKGNLPALGISGYVDQNGHIIKQTQQAVVGGVEGVYGIILTANAKNVDNSALTFTIVDASPAAFKNAIMTTSNGPKTMNTNQIASWNTPTIDVTPFLNTEQTFCVKIRASATGRQSVDKQSCITFRVDPDPVAGFEVTLDNGLNGTSNPDPNQNLPPENNTQNNTNPPNPPTVTFETNAVPGAYANYKSGTWIRVDTNADGILDQYSYASSVGSTGACPGTLVTHTPENFEVRVYSGSSGLSVNICSTTFGQYKKYN